MFYTRSVSAAHFKQILSVTTGHHITTILMIFVIMIILELPALYYWLVRMCRTSKWGNNEPSGWWPPQKYVNVIGISVVPNQTLRSHEREERIKNRSALFARWRCRHSQGFSSVFVFLLVQRRHIRLALVLKALLVLLGWYFLLLSEGLLVRNLDLPWRSENGKFE